MADDLTVENNTTPAETANGAEPAAPPAKKAARPKVAAARK